MEKADGGRAAGSQRLCTLMEKAAFAAECAGRCFDRMEVRVEGGQVLPYFKENVERRSGISWAAL